MMWRAIGQSVAGTSHIAAGKGCEDAVCYKVFEDVNGNEALACCISDGAGSASQAAFASALVTRMAVEQACELASMGAAMTEAGIYAMAEEIYSALETEALANGIDIIEYSCTMAGCIITQSMAVFFQVGDGAIVRNDETGNYCAVWWPQNGEYQNTTCFITDDPNFPNLNVLVTETPVTEVALFTDGLQLLALNMDTSTVHQPLFRDLLGHLRRADSPEKTELLNGKLAVYLDSPSINARTDDDKTLFLATRLPA